MYCRALYANVYCVKLFGNPELCPKKTPKRKIKTNKQKKLKQTKGKTHSHEKTCDEI